MKGGDNEKMNTNITSTGLMIALYYLNLSLGYAIEQNESKVEGGNDSVSIEQFRFGEEEDLNEYIQKMAEQY